MTTDPTPQTIPSDHDFERAQAAVDEWLPRFATGVAPHSNAALALRDTIAGAIADGRHDELVAEQGPGPVELTDWQAPSVLQSSGDLPLEVESDELPVVVATLRRLVAKTRDLGGLDSVVLTIPGDPEGVRIVAVVALEDWLEGLATSVQYGGTL